MGDRVIQKKNDYDRELFNSDLGVITDVDLEEQEVTLGVSQRLVN